MPGKMGTLRVPIEVASLGARRFERFEALVDTGASYSLFPRQDLERLGVLAEEECPFVLADGREVSYQIGSVLMRLGGRTRSTVVIFGDAGAEPLLGVVTLEEFRLGVDPLGQRLIPVPGLLRAAAALA